ncbi:MULTISPECIES: hypothetical protein [Alphaproteobacteria]|uniref:hypothetical protein n=1 Tax=Alphaproteobacteria TaxID=28211 RepID=UPI0012BD7964|nr:MULTISPECIES: hypothetical protein [Alphaproteobacteria]MTI03041.1 hypothetical protein [Roseibium sp. RKSG952]
MTLLRAIALVAATAMLSGCGADGEPIQPTLNANVGVSNNGAYVSGGVGVNRGPLSVFFGL